MPTLDPIRISHNNYWWVKPTYVNYKIHRWTLSSRTGIKKVKNFDFLWLFGFSWFFTSSKNRFLLKTKIPNKKRSADSKSALNSEFNYVPHHIWHHVGCEVSFLIFWQNLSIISRVVVFLKDSKNQKSPTKFTISQIILFLLKYKKITKKKEKKIQKNKK